MQPYTQTPNRIYAAMPEMGEAELRCVLVVTRMTRGYHRPNAVISLSYFEKATGLSRPAVLAGLRQAMTHGYISRERSGRSYAYALVDNSAPGADASPQPAAADSLSAPQPSVKPVASLKKETLREAQNEEMLITISAAAAEIGEAPLENVAWLARRAAGLGMGDGDLWCLWIACRKTARKPLGFFLHALNGDGGAPTQKRGERATRARSSVHQRFREELRQGV
jgi:hypothetical protein